MRPVQIGPRKSFSAVGLALGLVGVAIVTGVFSRFLPVNTSTVGFCYLLVVLGVATASGFRVSALVSLAAMLCFNFFFLPPVGRLTIADPENWVALFTFLLTALVASHLSDRAQRQAAEAKRRQRETEQLYALSRAILLTEPSHSIGQQTARTIAQVFGLDAVVIFDAKSGQSHRGGPEEIANVASHLEEIVRVGNHMRQPEEDLEIWPISLGGNPIGALAILRNRISDGAVQSMLNLVAIALERVRTQEAATRAEVARQSEEFKSTLLDAIAHEFKTPLTSIKAAATGLRTLDLPRPQAQDELTCIIEEEVDRLSGLVNEAVKMAEIDAGKVKLNRIPVSGESLLESACKSFDGRGAERITFEATTAAMALADPELMTLAIRQVIDNALKYSDGMSPILCRACQESGGLMLRVHDQGPGISERDRERIFDKFYRRSAVRDHVPGSGLGLHIAREITRMHGGDLWVEPADLRGAVFCFRLPVITGERA